MVTHSSILAWKISRTEERAWQATVFIGSQSWTPLNTHLCNILLRDFVSMLKILVYYFIFYISFSCNLGIILSLNI